MSFFWVFLGGGLGSLCRFSIARWLPVPDLSFPWPTFWANLISSFILGWLVAMKAQGQLSASAQFFLMAGFCGGFSTFSTFSYEAYSLLSDGRLTLAFAYLAVSMAMGLLAVFAGVRVGMWV
jgi:fluoride exporter